MLIRTDPYRELDRLTERIFGAETRPAAMPMDAYRKDDSFHVHFDLPGVQAGSIVLTVEHNVLTVSAERLPQRGDGAETIIAERPFGTFSRQLFLGDALDPEHIAADYAAGVLTLKIPVRESAKAHNIPVATAAEAQPVGS